MLPFIRSRCKSSAPQIPCDLNMLRFYDNFLHLMLYYGQSAWWRGRGATFPKRDARVNYHLIILSSLLWECPQLWAFQIWRWMQGQVFSHVENLTYISSVSDQTKFQGRRKKPFPQQHHLQHVKDWHSIDLSSSKTTHKINSLNFNYDFFPPQIS
jgi:hypothetical protein